MFTSNGLDQNRNSIFVLANSKIIANYTHNKDFVLDHDEEDPRNIYTIISDKSYNKELCLNAVRKIENQYKDIVVWQFFEPKNQNVPMYTRVTMNTLRSIFDEYGIDGLESYTYIYHRLWKCIWRIRFSRYNR